MERETRNDGLLEIFPRIPNYTGRVVLFEGEIPIHQDKTNWVFHPEGQRREIPVYSVWNYDYHQEIVNQIAQGKAAALYMWGTFGIGMLLDSPMWQEKDEVESADLRQHLKIGRPWDQQFVNFMHPDDMVDFWDIDRFHPNFRTLQWASNRWKLYQSGPVHVVAPTKKKNPYLDISLLKEEDISASYFYMPHPALNRIIEMLRRDVKHSVFGGGSLNPHGGIPPFTTRELYTQISRILDWQKHVDLILVDEIAEFFKIFRSQTQIRIPQNGSEGKIELVRLGATDAARWVHEMGYEITDAPEGVKEASSVWPYTVESNQIVDGRVRESVDKMRILHQKLKAGVFN